MIGRERERDKGKKESSKYERRMRNNWNDHNLHEARGEKVKLSECKREKKQRPTEH